MTKITRAATILCLSLAVSGCLEVKFIGLESLRHKACIARTGLPCDD